MSRISRRHIAAAIAPFALLATAPAMSSAATAFYGVTSDNHLAEFQSDNTTQAPALPIRGLAAGENVVGLDIRPADGRLYGLTNKSRIVVINPRTATITYVGDKAIDPALTGDKAGFDFDPVLDSIRVETNAAQNLRIDPRTGQLQATTTTVTPTPTPTPDATTPTTPSTTPQPTTVSTPGKADGNAAYAAGDPGAGTAPKITALAYTNAFPVGNSTELFALDSARKTLVKQDPQNDGTLHTVGSLNQSGNPIAFDIADGNVGYAAISTTSGGTRVGLYKVNLSTGAAAPVGGDNVVGTNQPIVAIAADGVIGDDTTAPKLSVASSSTQLRSRLLTGGLQMTVNANEAITGTASVRYKGHTVGTADVEIDGTAGSDRVTVPLSSATKSAIRGKSLVVTLKVDVADGAGNRSSISRPIRTR
ncbi:MAG: DUF4394 domain-containing protein [Solirubrobacteraceae bacterium]|nr:DUF4394 domain-containing protein [Patulibacter sp.]